MTVQYDPAAPAPALFLDPPQWKGLARLLDDPFFAQLHAKSVALLEDVFGQQAADPSFPKHHRACKLIIQHASAAWHITGEKRYLDLATATLHRACGMEWRPNQPRGIHGADLKTGELMYTVAFGLDALYGDLSAEDRRLCVETLVGKGLACYFRGIELQDWWLKCDFNWNSALHGNAGIAALAVKPHAPAAAEHALAEARKGLPYMIDACAEGGGWTEGLMYFGTAVGHLTDFAFALERATGDNFGVLTNKRLHDTFDFILNMHGGDGRAYNFSDMHDGPGGWAMPHTFWYARTLNRPDWTADQEEKILARRGHLGGLFGDVDCYWYRLPGQESRKAPARRGIAHYKGLDWAAWRGEHSWAAFRGGYNGGNHNNHDLGHFIFGIDRTRFLCDPGYGMKQADMHSTPLMRFHDQTECATAPVLRCDPLGSEGFYLVCDLRAAFPFSLERFDRHLLLFADRYLLVVDDVKGRGVIRNDLQENLQTFLPAEVTDEGFVIRAEGSALRVVLGGEVDGKQVQKWEMRRTSCNRLLWYDSYYRIHSVQPFLLVPDDSAVSFGVSLGGVSVKVGGRTVTVRLRDSWQGGGPVACELA